MKKLIRMMATCRNFRQVVAVRFFRTTTNLFQFVTQCVTNSVIRNFRTTELQFAGMKISIADHFRDLTKLIIIVKGGKREVEDYSELPTHVKTMDGFYAPFYKMNKELQFLLYTTPNENIKIGVVVNNETLWLTQKAMSELIANLRLQLEALNNYQFSNTKNEKKIIITQD